MPCYWMKLANGTVVHVNAAKRRAKKCEFCDRPSTKQCDYPLDKEHTCDAFMCDYHAKPFTPNVDTCPRHPVMRYL
jgi:hypothetical protein